MKKDEDAVLGGGPPTRRSDVVFRPVGSEWVVYDPENNEMHVLNLTSALVWEMCRGDTSPEEMATLLAELLTDAPGPDVLRMHVTDALAAFTERGLLR